jgi:S1-C subfamily serine protease
MIVNSHTKLAGLLSLALLAAGPVLAQGIPAEPPVPPPSQVFEGAANQADLEAKLADAQRQLEQAAHQVAELSIQVNRPYIRHFTTTTNGEVFGHVIVGLQLDPHNTKESGALVLEVSPGGPAAEAGIRGGDVIVNVNGESIRGTNASRRVLKIMREVRPDTKLAMRVQREGSERTFTVTPREGPDVVTIADPFGEIPEPPMPPAFMVEGPLSNMELATLTPRLGKYFGTEKGILVIRAPGDGQLKLEDGDVILAIDGREPTSGSHATRILSSYQPGEKINLKIVRERKTLDLQATI